jgi:hypothetical protein
MPSAALHAIEEVKVLTTALRAEYGHYGGGVMSSIVSMYGVPR